MATIKIGSARIDENGNTSGGIAGDQTGKEVSTQTMYSHSKGWYIIRAKKINHANKLAKAMKQACANDNIGYDQNNRLAILKVGTATESETECDCSSLVRCCITEATGTDVGNFTTLTEAKILANSGLFEDKITYKSQAATPVYNGDILVTKTKGHTAIVVSGNPRKSAEDSEETTSTSSGYTAGQKVTLKKCPLYATASTSTVANTLSGTYYLWDATVLKKRIRITNKKANAGVSGKVTGWINVSVL